jgi:hypothetical protein
MQSCVELAGVRASRSIEVEPGSSHKPGDKAQPEVAAISRYTLASIADLVSLAHDVERTLLRLEVDATNVPTKQPYGRGQSSQLPVIDTNKLEIDASDAINNGLDRSVGRLDRRSFIVEGATIETKVLRARETS